MTRLADLMGLFWILDFGFGILGCLESGLGMALTGAEE